MKDRKRRILALIGTVVLLFSSCRGTEQAKPKPQTEQTVAVEDQKVSASPPLRLGVLFNPDDSVDPATITSPGGMALAFYVYDTLCMMSEDGIRYSLAESIEPNAAGDIFTIVLKDNLQYSDGSPVTGQDIIDSIVYLSKSAMYQSMYSNLDQEGCSASGNTAILKLKSPMSDFVFSSLAMFSPIAPKGAFKGIGAGPYVIKEGDASSGYTLTAHEEYHAGKPPIHEVILLPVTGSASQANALRVGEIDYAWGLDPAAIQSLEGADDIEMPESTLDSAVAKELVLNTRVAPFNDPEVRHAAKLTIDREKMVNTLLGESGELANDMLGKGYDTYPEDIPQREADKEEAKRIFQEKGVTEFTIVASDIVPGQVAASELMQQEFADVGVVVTIKELDPQSFFAQMEDLYKESAFTFYWVNRTPIAEFRSQVLKDSPYNVSGYYSDVTEEEFIKATFTSDEAVQNDAIREISKDIHENGGELIWGYQKQLSAHRKGLQGVVITQSIPWIAQATLDY
ncbi:MAG: ABC transporter substrate-binding protein [Tissierellia bacterium]|nr:ABC transporter substrate-binding protein [Tissierellia bacterium]